jgi:hypothetical protein
MPYFYWKNEADIYRATGYSDASPRNTITIPLGRQSYLLSTGGTNNPIWIQQAKMYLAGRGGTRTASIVIGNSTTSSFSLANAGTSGSATDTGWKDTDYKYSGTSAASISVGYNTNGSTFFGRYGTTADTTTLWGRCFYSQVPTAPTSVSASSPSANTLRVSWSVPSDDGGLSVSGYYVQISTSSSFSTIASFEEKPSSASSHDFSGLSAGTTYYARVFAYNDTYYVFQNYPMSVASQTASAVISAPPEPVWTTDSTLTTAQINSAYSTTVTATNTDSYSKVSGDSWLSVSSSGTVSGTAPSSVGTASITVRATGSGGSVDRAFSVPIDGPAPSWNTSSPLTSVAISTYYSLQLSATNATSYQKLSGGSNDSWISVSSSGLITGTSPSSASSVSFTVRATGNGKNTDKTFSLDVTQPSPSWVTGTSLPAAQQSVAYSTNVSASYTSSYSKVSGDSWISVSSSGTVSGTPTSSGTASVTIRATGPTGLTSDRSFTISVASAPVPVWVTTSPLPNVVVGSAYNTSVSATNTQTYSKLSGGTNDAWVSVLSTGQVYGAPPTIGTTIVKIRATSSLGQTSDKDFSISVTAPLPAWTTNQTLIGGKANAPYSATVSASNTDSYAISGTKPSWISLNTSTGLLSGTPTEEGSYSVTVVPTGPGGVGPSRTFSISISSASPVWVDSQLQNASGVLNVQYSDGFSASNVVSSSGYLITGLPTGITYNSTTGAISGYPTQTGQFNVQVTAFGLDGTNITSSSILNIYYPGERKTISGSFSSIATMQRFNGTSWVPVQFVKRKTASGWENASN